MFFDWMGSIVSLAKKEVVAIDGKTIKGSVDSQEGKATLHIVSAVATENRLTLGQETVSEKSNEITAIPKLLKKIDIEDAIVTIDAMGCQKKDCKGNN